jgi:hypothetical protein
MIFKPIIDFRPYVFHTLPAECLSHNGESDLWTLTPVYGVFRTLHTAGTVHKVSSIDAKLLALDLPVSVGISRDSQGDVLGTFFYPKLPSTNLGTALLIFQRSWVATSEKLSLPSTTSLLTKMNDLYFYSVPNKACLVASCEVTEEIDSYLTMI